MKERREFTPPQEGTAEILCLRIKNPLLADTLMDQPGYLRGYPGKRWNWVSVLLDGTVPLEEVRKLLDESWRATKSKTKYLKTPLKKRTGSRL